MPGHCPNPPVDSEAQLEEIVERLFREEGWKVAQALESNDGPYPINLIVGALQRN